jgi:hypothetical protein
MSLYRETTKVTIQETETNYVKPALAQLPYFTQWLLEGLAPIVFSSNQVFATEGRGTISWQDLTLSQKIDKTIKYWAELTSSDMPEDQKNLIMGSALITTSATLDYLYPALSQCFPELEIELLTDDALNEAMTYFFQDILNVMVDK